MRADEMPAFKDLLTDAMAYYGKDCSAFTLTVWWGALQGCELEQVATLTKLANDSASIALNLMAANKETIKELNTGEQPVGYGSVSPAQLKEVVESVQAKF